MTDGFCRFLDRGCARRGEEQRAVEEKGRMGATGGLSLETGGARELVNERAILPVCEASATGWRACWVGLLIGAR